jgi:hypothetical protein
MRTWQADPWVFLRVTATWACFFWFFIPGRGPLVPRIVLFSICARNLSWTRARLKSLVSKVTLCTTDIHP